MECLESSNLFYYPNRLFFKQDIPSQFTKYGEKREFPKNATLASPGDMPNCCYLILSGQVVTGSFTPTGIEHTYNYIESGGFIMDGNILTQHEVSVFFKTSKQSVLLALYRDNLIRAMSEDKEIMLFMVNSINDKFESAMRQLRDSIYCGITWRTCKLLLTTSQRYGEKNGKQIIIKEKIGQQDIADTLCVSRMSVFRAIRELKDLEIIDQKNGYFIIKDIDRAHGFMEDEEY